MYEDYDNNMANGEVTIPAETFDKTSAVWTNPNIKPQPVDANDATAPSQWTTSNPISKWDLKGESTTGQTYRAMTFDDWIKLGEDGVEPVETEEVIEEVEEEPEELEEPEEDHDLPDGGNCFDSAYDLMMRMGSRKPDLKLVHGIVSGQGQLSGWRFTHAWCEDDHTVYDHANGKDRSISKMLYYAIGNIRPEECVYYNYPEAMDTSVQHGHKGPWDIENTHYKEDWSRDRRRINESDHDFTPLVHHIKVESIGIKDKNGKDILVGDVIRHNDNLYVIKMSNNLHKFVARKEPLKGQKYSWRDTDWISRVRPFITVVGSVVTNHELYKKFVGVITTLRDDR